MMDLRELDLKIAEKVFGKTMARDLGIALCREPGYSATPRIPLYTRDKDAAYEALGRISKCGLIVAVQFESVGPTIRSRAKAYDGSEMRLESPWLQHEAGAICIEMGFPLELRRSLDQKPAKEEL